MRTRAVAIASDRSNAVGTLELECTPEGLLIVHQGVGAFQQGYAPGALTSGTRVLVPWTAVREVSLEADHLFLQVDESLTPHHRLALAAFSEGDPPDPRELGRQRLVLRIGTGAAMLVGGLLTATAMARLSSTSGAASAVLLGCFAAMGVFFAGMVAEHRIFHPHVTSDATRLAFATELTRHVPGLVVHTAPVPPSKAPPPITLPSFQTLLPRSTTAVVITMSAALLGAVLTASWVSRTPVETTTMERGAAALEREHAALAVAPAAVMAATAPLVSPAPAPAAPSAAPVSPSPAALASDTAVLAGACSCRRADSTLWREGLPRLSMVLIDKRQKVHNQHDHLELELGVVNNWDAPLPEVSLVVRFFEKDPPPSTKRTPTFDRPVYFEGPLGPGQAIKWHVEARGNDFEVEGLPAVTLDPSGSDAAPTNLLAELLLRANHRPIRLHGAMMLAYLGDARAKDGALGLREALREDEAPYLDRLMWALSPVRTCAIDAAEAQGPRTVHACVFNATKEPQKGLAMRVRALDRPFRHTTPVEAPPLVIAEKVWKLSGELAPDQGGLVSVSFDPSNPDGLPPAAFEVYADRADLVF